MKENTLLTVASLVSIVLLTFHLTDDAFHTKAGVSYPASVAIMVVWLYGTVMLAGRRSGYVVALLGAILGAVVPFVHVVATGGVVGGANAPSPGSYFFVWNHFTLGSTSVFAGILSVRGLWSLRRGRSRQQDAST